MTTIDALNIYTPFHEAPQHIRSYVRDSLADPNSSFASREIIDEDIRIRAEELADEAEHIEHPDSRRSCLRCSGHDIDPTYEDPRLTLEGMKDIEARHHMTPLFTAVDEAFDTLFYSLRSSLMEDIDDPLAFGKTIEEVRRDAWWAPSYIRSTVISVLMGVANDTRGTENWEHGGRRAQDVAGELEDIDSFSDKSIRAIRLILLGEDPILCVASLKQHERLSVMGVFEDSPHYDIPDLWDDDFDDIFE